MSHDLQSFIPQVVQGFLDKQPVYVNPIIWVNEFIPYHREPMGV